MIGEPPSLERLREVAGTPEQRRVLSELEDAARRQARREEEAERYRVIVCSTLQVELAVWPGGRQEILGARLMPPSDAGMAADRARWGPGPLVDLVEEWDARLPEKVLGRLERELERRLTPEGTVMW